MSKKSNHKKERITKHILEITGTLLGVLGAALTALSLMKPRKREILMRKMKKYLRDLSQTINKCFLCIYQLIPGSSGKLLTEILDSRKYGLSDNYLAVKVTYRPVVFRIPFTEVKSNAGFWLGHIKDEHDYSWHALYDLPVEKTGRQFIWVSDNEEEQGVSFHQFDQEPQFLHDFYKEKCSCQD